MTSIPNPPRLDADDRAAIRARLAALARRTIDPARDGRALPQAAVLVPLGIWRGRPAVLFTKRTDTVGTHKGQVSFPGGRMDPHDKDEVACALRELEEELGVAPANVEVLGPFHEVMSITGVRVTPIVGFLGELDPARMTPRPDEVESVFALTLDEILDPTKREVRDLGPRKAPFYLAGPHPVWGLTAFILHEVLQDALGLEVPPLE